MKKILFAALIMISTSVFGNQPTVDEKISSKFKETFPNALNTKWYENENGYEVLFEAEHIPCRIQYDLNGKVVSVRRDYYEKDLSLFITAKVKEKYAGKKIFGVTEITTTEGISYTIILEDEKNWITIKSGGSGDMEVVQKLKKA